MIMTLNPIIKKRIEATVANADGSFCDYIRPIIHRKLKTKSKLYDKIFLKMISVRGLKIDYVCMYIV